MRIGGQLRAVEQKVVNCLLQKLRAVHEFSDAVVTVVAEESAKLLGRMVVVHVQVLGSVRKIRRPSTDSAHPTLGGKSHIIVGNGYPVVEPEHTVACLIGVNAPSVPLAGGFTVARSTDIANPSGTVYIANEIGVRLNTLTVGTNPVVYLNRWNLGAVAKMLLKKVRRYPSIAPVARHFNEPAFHPGFHFGRLGHVVKWLRSLPMLKSSWHHPQGTFVGGLPPGCLAGNFLLMEISI